MSSCFMRLAQLDFPGRLSRNCIFLGTEAQNKVYYLLPSGSEELHFILKGGTTFIVSRQKSLCSEKSQQTHFDNKMNKFQIDSACSALGQICI